MMALAIASRGGSTTPQLWRAWIQGPRGLLLLGQYFLNQTLLQSLRQNLAHQVG